jgi:NAD(P)-dependent dehydrogenase (short-subunit alcohol dehydrogenase family)
MSRFQRVALVTAGDRWIGRDAALELARGGVHVIITYRTNGERAARTVREIEGLGRLSVALRLDVGRVAAIDEFVLTLRRALREVWSRDSFDFLVNSAGAIDDAWFVDVTEEQFDRLVDVNFKGVFFLTQGLSPLIAEHGAIVNVSSARTATVAPEGIVCGATRAAVELLTRYWAKELASRHITVNAVAPSTVAAEEGDRDAVTEGFGGAIAALLGDSNRSVTGQRIEVSGVPGLG